MNMLDRISLLSKGECVKVDVSILCDVDSIFYDLKPNKKYEDSITIFNDREMEMDIRIYSDNVRVSISNNSIVSSRAKIKFIINTNNLENDDIISGNIYIVSSIGELKIPYNYHIVGGEKKYILNSFIDITDYQNYLINNFDDAVSIFQDPIFLEAPFMQDAFVRTVYDGLIKGSNKNVAIIEFFKAFNIDVVKLFKNVEDTFIKNVYFPDVNSDVVLNTTSDSEDNLEEVDIMKYVEEKNDKLLTSMPTEVINRINDKDLMETIAIACIRNGLKDKVSFRIYLKCIENSSSINGLYEYLLLSMPKDFDERFPIYIYRYYFEDKSYSFIQKANLYNNIINVFNETDDIYMLYINEIREYALTQIYQNKLNESLVKIYSNILSKEIINENNSKNIIYLLRNHKIIIKNKSIKKVILKYRETKAESEYDVINNVAFIPIFFDSYVLFFEDSYNNRFFEAEYTIRPMFSKTDLLSYCLEKYPDEDIIKVTQVLNFKDKPNLLNDEEVSEAKYLLATVKLNDNVKDVLVLRILDYYYNKAIKNVTLLQDEYNFVMSIKFSTLYFEDKRKVCKILLKNKDYQPLFDILVAYNINLLDRGDLEDLYVNIIKENVDINKNNFNILLFDFFKEGTNNLFITDYLCEYYVSSNDNMLLLLRKADELNINTFIFAKRLLKQILFDNVVNDIDYVFSKYDYNSDNDDTLFFAYLTKRSTDYFLDDVSITENIILDITDILVRNIDDFEKQPLIYVLAFSKYMSTIDDIKSNDMRRVLIRSIDLLIGKDLIFAFFKKLNKHIRLPYNIMNKEYIEFHASKDFIPKAKYTINDSKEVKEIDLIKIYKNIYVKQVTVFKNEIINYQVYNSDNIDDGILKEGTLIYDEKYELEYPRKDVKKSNFDIINEAIIYFEEANFDALKKVIVDSLINKDVSKEIFNIDD